MGACEIALRCTDPWNREGKCPHYKKGYPENSLIGPGPYACEHVEGHCNRCTHPAAQQAAIRDAVLTALEGMLGLAPQFDARPIESKEAHTCSSPEGFGDAVLHRLWTQAVGTPGYDKAAWQQLGQLVYAGIAAGKEKRP